jgi:CDP-diacylglycerol--glycerol-3-phosphate 3-phosphatidyltransferase/cardiolipin synthase
MSSKEEAPAPPGRSTFFSAEELLLLPNVLTMLRIPLAVAFPLVIGSRRKAAAVLALAGLTDVLDGFVARHSGHSTATGSVLDPIADKVFAASVVGTLVAHGKLPRWGVPALLAREILEAPLVVYMLYELKTGTAPRPGEVRASIPGKVATITQFATILSAIAAPPLLVPMLGLCVATGAVSGVAYWRRELIRRRG